MSAIEAMRETIRALPQDAIFATRDFVKFGLRNTIDQAIFRLIKAKIITRVAPGIFIKYGAAWPAAFDVALCKARAFGKELVTHGQVIAQKLNILPPPEEIADTPLEDNLGPELLFQVRGRSSSFSFGNKRIHMRGASDRVVRNGESPIGRVIRALWFIGKKFGDSHLRTVISAIDLESLSIVLEQAAWMPAWLSDRVRMDRDIRSRLTQTA